MPVLRRQPGLGAGCSLAATVTAGGPRRQRRSLPSAKCGVHTYAEYAKSRLITILHVAKGFTYFLHILHIVLHILLHILHIALHIPHIVIIIIVLHIYILHTLHIKMGIFIFCILQFTYSEYLLSYSAYLIAYYAYFITYSS